MSQDRQWFVQTLRRLGYTEAAEEAGRRIAAGQPRNAAIAAVAQESGLRRAEVYDAVLAARRAHADRGPQSS